MSESAGVIPRIDETDTEIELSAQDLLALSEVEQVDKHPRSSAPPLKPATGASPHKPGLTLSLIAAVGVVGAIYGVTSSDGANPSVANTSQQTAQSEWPAPQQLAESEPVRFANPFDAGEVFEFPPGTTETQARDAVADLLLKRAISRQET